MIGTLPPPVVVCDTCAVQRLDEALRRAKPGATIEVQGEQHGRFIVRVPVTIAGSPGAVLDGDGSGSVLDVRAPGVTIRDIAIRNTGSDFVAMDAAIRSSAPRTIVERAAISDSLFGVYFVHADDAVVDSVHIQGRKNIPIPMRGEGVRAWYSRNVRITNNTIENVRDNLVWFSADVSIVGNTVTGGRYGFHSMYSNGMTIESNVVDGCEIGSYLMYGHNIHIEHNIFENNRGSTGYAIGMKSIDDSTISNNALVSNHVGIYVDNSPSLMGSVDRFSANLFAYNGTGFAGLPSSTGDLMLGNTFMQNYRQVAVLGGGTLSALTWSQAGHGNYWSDYAGYDRNNDGVGDVHYQERSAYGVLSDLDDRLALLSYSPAAGAIDFAANALPVFAPPPTLTDAAPLMQPIFPRGLPMPSRSSSSVPYAVAGSIALMASLGVLLPMRPARHKKAARVRTLPTEPKAISARGVRKSYGHVQALAGVDLDIAFGETIALWGPNGSGKTTLMRALLGEIQYEGTVKVGAPLGYVPQHLPEFEMRAEDLVTFIASLRGVSKYECDAALERSGLGEARTRYVGELSGGQRQHLAIALAGIGDPDILLLDEPTVGLDLGSRNAILRYLREAKAHGRTVVISSHIPEDVSAIADRIAVMQDGRIVNIATPSEFAAMIERRREAS